MASKSQVVSFAISLTTTTAVQVTSSKLPAGYRAVGLLLVQGAASNTETVYVGDGNSQNYQLAAGKTVPFRDVSTVDLYLRTPVATTTQVVHLIAVM